MTQSHHSSCYHHSHDDRHHHHERHKKDHAVKASGSKKDLVKAKDVKETKEVPQGKSEAKKPPEKPWSPWIAGDNGRYFYRGRQKSTGDWDYQFIEGYPTPVRRDTPYGSQESVTYSTPATSNAAGSNNVPAAASTAEASYPIGQGVQPNGPTPQLGAVEKDKSSSPKVSSSKVKLQETSHKGKKPERAPDKKSKKRIPPPKKIGTVVNAEKGKKFSPQTKVRGWLDDVEPEEDEEE